MRIVRIKQEKGEASGPDYLSIQRCELENAERALPYVERDSRQGYHSEARAYFFDADRLRRKISLLRRTLGMQ